MDKRSIMPKSEFQWNFRSHEWVCKECGLCMRNALASETVRSDNADAIEARRLVTQISIKVSKYFATLKLGRNIIFFRAIFCLLIL